MPEDEKKEIEPIFTQKKFASSWEVVKSWQSWDKVLQDVCRSGKNTFSDCRQYVIWRYQNNLKHW